MHITTFKINMYDRAQNEYQDRIRIFSLAAIALKPPLVPMFLHIASIVWGIVDIHKNKNSGILC